MNEDDGRDDQGIYGYCARCRRPLAWGETKYLVSVTFTADFDGVIPDEGGAESIPALLEEMAGREVRELEDEVHCKVDYLLCKKCRDAVRPDPLGLRPGEADGPSLIH